MATNASQIEGAFKRDPRIKRHKAAEKEAKRKIKEAKYEAIRKAKEEQARLEAEERERKEKEAKAKAEEVQYSSRLLARNSSLTHFPARKPKRDKGRLTLSATRGLNCESS